MMTQPEKGELYRLAQAQKLLDLFEGAHGRQATSIEELEKWAGSPQGGDALAYDHNKDGKIIPDLSR
jgi:hypothetical protein